MSRTYRRRGERYEYDWVLRDSGWVNGRLVEFRINARSKEGRRAIARFHSDAYWSLRRAAPRWYGRIFHRRVRTINAKQFRRWLEDRGHDPVFQVRHRHNANWSWW